MKVDSFYLVIMQRSPAAQLTLITCLDVAHCSAVLFCGPGVCVVRGRIKQYSALVKSAVADSARQGTVNCELKY